MDSAGRPHISYYNATGQDLKYARWTGNTWVTETVDAAGNVGQYSSLALDSAGNPRIAYVNTSNGDLKFAKDIDPNPAATSWVTETIDTAGTVGYTINLALDSAGNPRICYHDLMFYNYVSQWGSLGSGNGQFNNSATVAVDNAGFVYISDRSNSRIQKFTSDGTYVTQWGGYGTGDGQFNMTSGVAVDNAGYVYVTDAFNRRIQKFTDSGVYVTQWGGNGTGDGQFGIPFEVAVDGAGYVYVADPNNFRIQKFTSDGTYVTKWGVNGTGNGEFRSIIGVAADNAGYIYTTDNTLNRVQKFTSDGTYVTQWGINGTANGQFRNPRGIVADNAGYIYVADFDNSRVQKLFDNGTFLLQWGGNGTDNGQFRNPRGVAVNGSGYVYVTDWTLNRVQRFAPNGRTLRYASWNGAAWDIQILESQKNPFGSAGGGGPGWSSMKLDSSGNPHISYGNLTEQDLKYAWFDGTNWHNVTVDTEGAVGAGSSLALRNGNPRIVYYDRMAFNATAPTYLKIAAGTFSGDTISWIISTIGFLGTSNNYNLNQPSLALDSAGNPRISCYNASGTPRLQYASWTGSQWVFEDVDATIGGVGLGSSLAIDSSGNPQISYHDWLNGDLKYAALVDFSFSVSPTSHTVMAGGQTGHYITVVRTSGPTGPITLNLLDLPPNVGSYVFIPQSSTQGFTAKLIIYTFKTTPPPNGPIGTYNLTVVATYMGATETMPLRLIITAPLNIILDLEPRTVARGSTLRLNGTLTPPRATTLKLYYRLPHETGTWKLATTLTTNSAGVFNVAAPVPTSLPPGNYDLRAVWFDEATGDYVSSPIKMLTIT